MIGIQDIKQICIAIVSAWPYHSRYRLNTFSVIESADDWQSNNFNKGGAEADNLDYWTRGGVDRQSGYLTLEHRETIIDGVLSDTEIMDLWFSVALDRECDGCGVVSSREVYYNAELLMGQFIREFCSFDLYDSDESVKFWATSDSFSDIATANGLTNPVFVGGSSLSMSIVKPNSPMTIQEQELSLYRMVGVAFNLKIKICYPKVRPNFDYTQKSKRHPTLLCQSCS